MSLGTILIVLIIALAVVVAKDARTVREDERKWRETAIRLDEEEL